MQSAEFSGSSQTLGMENEDEMWRGLFLGLDLKIISLAVPLSSPYLIITNLISQPSRNSLWTKIERR